MTYEVQTPVFEGPLDLLVQLITSRTLDVADVSLRDIVADYLSAIDRMKALDLDVTSEFLVVAATLIQLKIRRLLPDGADVELDDDLALAEERDRLLARLLANLTFKDVAAVIAHRMETTSSLLARRGGFDPGFVIPERTVNLQIDAAGLAAIADRVQRRAAAGVDLDHLDLDLPSVGDAIAHVRRRLEEEAEIDFDSLAAPAGSTLEVIAYFLAVLELARWGLLEARQDEPGAEITVRATGAASEALVSEWDDARE